MQMYVVDVNGLGGGLALGLANAGHELVLRVGDLDLGQKLVRHNGHLFGEDWEDAIDKGNLDVDAWPMPATSDVGIICAVPPCSGFSVQTGLYRGIERAGQGHGANDCMIRTITYAARVAARSVEDGGYMPSYIVFESVLGAYKIGRPLMNLLADLVREETGVDYFLTHMLHDGAVHGSPSSRQRYLFVLSPWSPIDPMQENTFARTVRQAIQDLPEHEGGVDGHHWPRNARVNQVERLFRVKGFDCWHEGESMNKVVARLIEQGVDLDDLAIALRDDFASRMRFVKRNGNDSLFAPRRWPADAPGYVIDGQGPTGTVHPWLPRPLTLRECARLVGYPDEFTIDDVDCRQSDKVSMWGKNVGPNVGRWIGTQIELHAEGLLDADAPGLKQLGPQEFVHDDLERSRHIRSERKRYLREARDV